MYLLDLLCYGFLLSWHFWQAWAAPFVNERASTLKIVNRPDSNLMFFFHWQMAHPFAVQDKFTRKTQDLNPECKEGSIQIMQLWVQLGIKPSKAMKKTVIYFHFLKTLVRDCNGIKEPDQLGWGCVVEIG